MADLNTILELLVDEFMAEKVDLKHDAARESFRLETMRVTTWLEFLDVIRRYYIHHFGKTMGDPSNMPDELITSNALRTMERAFRGGTDEAYKNAITGTQGGLKGVIDKMAEFLKMEGRQAWAAHVHSTAYDPMNWEDVESLARQFLDFYGRQLPEGGHAVSIGVIASKIRDYIQEMAEGVSKTRRGIQRRY